MYLKYQNLIRKEEEDSVISNLLRKGWIETVPPSYNTLTEQFPQWVNGEWVVLPIPTPEPYRVSKDTIVTRLISLNAIGQVISTISNLNSEQQFIWTNSAWFWSNNQTLIDLCNQLGLDSNVILAKDPYFN